MYIYIYIYIYIYDMLCVFFHLKGVFSWSLLRSVFTSDVGD